MSFETIFHDNHNYFKLRLTEFHFFFDFVRPTTRRAIYSETMVIWLGEVRYG